jgi:hypothetical protein
VKLMIIPSTFAISRDRVIAKVWLEADNAEKWTGSLQAALFRIEPEDKSKTAVGSLVGSVARSPMAPYATGLLRSGSLQRLPSVAVVGSTPIYFDLSNLDPGRYGLQRTFNMTGVANIPSRDRCAEFTVVGPE